MGEVKQVNLKGTSWGDQRGWGVNPLDAAGLTRGQLGDVHMVSMKPGAVRGNHYHTRVTEWLLVCGGPARFLWRSGKDDSLHEVTVSGEKPALFEVPPKVEHALMNTSKDEIYLLSFSDAQEHDIVRCRSLFDSQA